MSEIKDNEQSTIADVMPRLSIPAWDGLTDYRPPVFEKYKFNFKDKDPRSPGAIYESSLNYAREIVGDSSNNLWVERRKITDAFEMGIEYAKRFLI